MRELASDQEWLAQIQGRREGTARLPKLRLALTDFILTYHPGLPVFKGAEKYERHHDKNGVLCDAAYYGKPYFAWPPISPSTLKVLVLLGKGATTEIKVSSSAFPVNQSLIEDVMFIVEVPELDTRFSLGPSKEPTLTRVTSISRITEPFTRHTVIGSHVRSWSAWERPITRVDVESIHSILAKKSLKITPEPQKLITRDY